MHKNSYLNDRIYWLNEEYRFLKADKIAHLAEVETTTGHRRFNNHWQPLKKGESM